MRDVKVVSAVTEAVVKFKESEEFTPLLQKDYHNDYDVGVVEIFYNIWTKYRDLDYTFLRGELTSLIGEWLETEELNAPNPAPSSPPPIPSTEVATRADSMPAEASELQPMANADKEVATFNPPPTIEEPIGKVSS